MKLYELTNNYAHILELIQDGAEGLEDTLEALQDEIEYKAENIAKIIRTVDAECEAIKSEETRLADRRRAMENEVKRLKEYAEQQLIAVGIDKVKTPTFTIAIQNNPPSVDVVDEQAIPKSFWIEQEPKLDRKSLLQSLKDGVEIPGATIKQSRSLRIR